MRCLAALVIVGVLATLTVGCDADPADSADASQLLTAEEVGGTEADSGTKLLSPAVKDCPDVDGPRVWQDAADDDVRSFTRTVNGHTETTIIGAWPVPEDEAADIIASIGYGSDCLPRRVLVDGETLASLSRSYDEGSRSTKTAIEITHRDEKFDVDRRSVRAYAYTTSGYLVIVWVSHPDTKPSVDRISDLLSAQGDKLGD